MSAQPPKVAKPPKVKVSMRRQQPTAQQRKWLARGLDQAGGKLPLFDGDGQRVSERTVRSCIKYGWAEPWFANPLKPDWLVCRLTDAGRAVLATPEARPPAAKPAPTVHRLHSQLPRRRLVPARQRARLRPLPLYAGHGDPICRERRRWWTPKPGG